MVKNQQTQQRFLSDAVNQIQDDDPKSADVAIIGPPTGVLCRDLENEDNTILNTKGLPEEIAGEFEVFKFRKDETETMISDGEDRNVDSPLAKRQKQTAKKSKVIFK